ncbi:MAG: MFS transporter [Bacteroidota bacterium]
MNSLRLILSQKSYFAPSWVFASLNIMTGTWVLYLPHIKTKFNLNDSEVGLALFSLALGLLVSIPFVPFVNRKIGVGQSTQYGILLFALAYIIPLLAPSYWMLCSSLLLVGIFSGFTDISMNALVSTIEKNNDQHIMSAAHGFFSVGGFIGAGIGSLIMALIASPIMHMTTAALFIIFSNLLLAKYYSTIQEEELEESKQEKGKFKYIRPLLGLAIVAFVIMFSEGAVEHWSNLFLYDVVHLSENRAGLGFIAFSLCMTIGRFLGDGISKNIGPVKIIAGGCVIAFFGYLSIITSNLILSIAGFGILGLGLSVIVPELFRLAGKTKGVQASVGISIVSGSGFAGFLLGPVILGLISNWANLVWSFGFLAFLVLLALGLTTLRLNKTYKER